MDKVLGQEYANTQERTAFLRDNCDAVEQLGYVKPLASEQIEELKDKLVENNIQLRDVRADKRAQNKLYNEQIKQLEEENDGVTKAATTERLFTVSWSCRPNTTSSVSTAANTSPTSRWRNCLR